MEYFWSHTIWYVILGVITIVELTLVLFKANHRKFAFAYFLFLNGVAFNAEGFLLTLSKGYNYYPMIIRSAPFDDALAGNYFSQISLAVTALLICILNLNFSWILVLAFLYALIEESFLLLGIYEQYWYRTWMTMFLLILFFFLAKKLYQHILSRMTPFVLYILVLIGMFPLFVATLAWGFILSGYQNFSLTLLPDSAISRSLLIRLHFYILTLSMMFIYYRRPAWPWSAAVVLSHFGLNYMASKFDLMYFYNGWWYWIYTTVTIIWNYSSILLLDRMYNTLDRERWN